MNGGKYLADTNVFIGLLHGHPAIVPFLNEAWHYSFITRMELLSKPGLSTEEELEVNALLSVATLIPFTTLVEDSAISIRKNYKTKLPDAIIAATALSVNLPLLTFDAGFVKVEELTTVLLPY